MAVLNKWIQAFLVGGSIVALTACSAHRNHDQVAINDANSAYSSEGAEASGLGDESSFGDQAGGKGHLAQNTYHFDFDSTVVKDEDKPAIHANAQHIATAGSKVILEGHTDPRGSREYNVGLGERRAKSVANIMTAKGVNPGQVRIVSYGAEKLAAPGKTESDYQQDRRAVLVTSHDQSEG